MDGILRQSWDSREVNFGRLTGSMILHENVYEGVKLDRCLTLGIRFDRFVGGKENGRPSDDAHISKSRYGAPG
jgi:hypothetical protein